jgi:hypothetical protein
MRKRCRNPKHKDFRSYGGRGIGICERWDSYENFRTDMGPRPVGYSIERVDVNGNYCPENCIWIPMVQQAKNKRQSKTRRQECLSPASYSGSSI